MKKIFVLLMLIFVIGIFNFSIAQVDTVSFEANTSNIVIDTTSSNLWQIGRPQKIFFDSAHSGTKAILTDTINYYIPNDTSSFVYIIRGLTQTCITCMSFWQKYDMDTTGDKGIIDASYDGGNSWLLLKDTMFSNPEWSNFFWQGDYCPNTEMYYVHKLIASGRSNGWIQSYFCWNWWTPVKKDSIIFCPDSLMIRFTFISDSLIKNKEGWMIDDIVTDAAPPENCSGINENTIENYFSIFPNPASDVIIISSPPKSEIEIFNIQGQLIKSITATATATAAVTIDISAFAKGLYFVKVKTDKGIAVKKFVKE